ncbi:unnamed protein product [Parajaminaea phylloscopi]
MMRFALFCACIVALLWVSSPVAADHARPFGATAHPDLLETVSTTGRGFLPERDAALEEIEARHLGISLSTYRRNLTLITVDDYLSAFNVMEEGDPSGGVVNYVNETEARRLHLFGKGSNGGFRFGADLSEKNISLPGRKSLRFKSKDNYGYGLYVWHVAKGPAGCGTWPAIWTVEEKDWPTHGEIDVLEWFNGRRDPNTVTVHTGPNCTMPGDQDHRYYTGNSTGITDCRSDNGFNGGKACGIFMSRSPLSSGALHNANGGGYHVLERRADVLRVWFFTECSAPAELKAVHRSSKSVDFDASVLGQPDARFPASKSCDLRAHLDRKHAIIMNLTFCGGANGNWEAEGCLALSADCPSWINTPAATEYYKRPAQSLEFDIESFTFLTPHGRQSR